MDKDQKRQFTREEMDRLYSALETGVLESGENIKQCKSMLYDGENGFCCLGVDGHVNDWESEWVETGGVRTWEGGAGHPPKWRQVQWQNTYDVEKLSAWLHEDKIEVYMALIAANDSKGKTFKQIAAALRDAELPREKEESKADDEGESPLL